MADRIQCDGDMDHLDEIVVTGCTIHIERMGGHDWWAAIRTDKGDITLYLADVHITDNERDDLVDIREPLLSCAERWEGSGHRWHECDRARGHRHVWQHRCECGERCPT